MKKIDFFDFFNFSEICVIFAQICIFWPFSFFKRVLKGVEKYMPGKKICQKLANEYMFQLIKFRSPRPKFHAKNKNSLGGGGGNTGFPPPTIFKSRFFSSKFKTHRFCSSMGKKYFFYRVCLLGIFLYFFSYFFVIFLSVFATPNAFFLK